MAPGIASIMMLSVIVMARIDNVSAAQTSLNARMNDSRARHRGVVEMAYPETNDNILARSTVLWGVNPACVPIVTPISSPIAQPNRQWRVALAAMRFIEVLVWCEWCWSVMICSVCYVIRKDVVTPLWRSLDRQARMKLNSQQHECVDDSPGWVYLARRATVVMPSSGSRYPCNRHHQQYFVRAPSSDPEWFCCDEELFV